MILDISRVYVVIILLLTSVLAKAQVLDIADARTKGDGKTVSIQGIVTTGEESGELRFIQDETAGIALYGSANGSKKIKFLKPGDEVKITGKLGSYKGLLEIAFITSVTVVSSNNALPTAKKVSLEDIGMHESERVEVECLAFKKTGTFAKGSVPIEQKNTTSSVYVGDDSFWKGKPIPTETQIYIGVVSVYNNPQLLLLTSDNLVSQPGCLYFAKDVVESNIQKNSITLNFESNKTCAATVFLATLDGSYETVGNLTEDTKFEYTLTDLNPAQIYKCKVQLFKDGVSTESPERFIATASNSSGEIQVFFNNSIYESFSNGSKPETTDGSAFVAEIKSILKAAKSTVDICMYNAGNPSIIGVLENLHEKGVVIRYIADNETSNTALNNVPFEVLKDKSEALMHNKFIIIDRDDADRALVVSGSTNFTENQLFKDPNNLITIQDQTLAKTYTIEFEEMWGSKSSKSNPAKSAFGSAKVDNTPHHFNINGKHVSCFFSPSDQVTEVLESAITSSTESISAALLTCTHNTLGTALLNKHKAGISTRIIIENYDDIGTEYYYLRDRGVPIKNHYVDHQLHHKYMVVDEGTSNAFVVTGSHNWTYNATTNNDENTLIIHDGDIANMYRQEFEARWDEVVRIDESSEFLVYAYPNPVSDRLIVQAESPIEYIEVVNTLGDISAVQVTDSTISMRDFVPGLYHVKVKTAAEIHVFAVVKL